jgi:hypothetical protein
MILADAACISDANFGAYLCDALPVGLRDFSWLSFCMHAYAMALPTCSCIL